ncbi:MAG: KxYKxGKxW signal peptide domain-containing protein [Streptococcus parasanguinis]
MFFKRSKGDFRETERITRYKLIKSGKTWVRASVSRLGPILVSCARKDAD